MRHGIVSPDIEAGLQALKQRIVAAQIPRSSIDHSLNLATWNIREFGRKPRSEAAIHYLAEILDQFDLVSIVELRENLADLRRVMDLLGEHWRVVYSAVVPDDGGNGERFAYLYDRRMVAFNGLAADALPTRYKKNGEYLLSAQQWWRFPYFAAFRSGQFDFILMAVHLRWGPKSSNRRKELALLGEWLALFMNSEQAIDRDILVVGDFNLMGSKRSWCEAVQQCGLKIPNVMLANTPGSNLAKNKHYDQILHYPSAGSQDSFIDFGGVFDFHLDESHITELFPPGEAAPMSLQDYTYQLSDHLPLWVQIRTDHDQARLQQVIQG